MTSLASAKDVIITDLCNDAKEYDLTRLENTKACQSRVAAPEIDPSSAIVGLTLLLGGVAVIRGRRSTASKG